MTFLEKAFQATVDAIHPLRCGLCGLCADCAICERCRGEFRPLDSPRLEFPPSEPLQLVTSIFRYEGRATQAVQRLKYERVTGLADPMADLLQNALYELKLPPFDAIIPVPIHWRRRFMRGFNQAELLARSLPGSPSEGLVRVRSTRPQVGLSIDERRTNLNGAFEANSSVKGKVLLLVDDVYTSGSTARACGAALKKAGAAYVGMLTFASGRDLSVP